MSNQPQQRPGLEDEAEASLLSAGAGTTLIVAVPVANLHLHAQLDAPVGSQAIYGQPVRMLSADGDWCCIQMDDGYTGWVNRSSLSIAAPGHLHQRVHISSLSANIYREPDVTAHMPLLHLSWGTSLPLSNAGVDAEGRWLEVRLVSGGVGYLQRGDVSMDWPLLDEERMLALGLRFLGITYTWGGTSSFGFDCSGLTQSLLRQRGLIMPRDARVQATWQGSHDIARDEVRAGDLLFFAEDGENVTHTGIALDTSRFLHASTRGRPGVQISPIAEPHWQQRLVAQRRVR